MIMNAIVIPRTTSRDSSLRAGSGRCGGTGHRGLASVSRMRSSPYPTRSGPVRQIVSACHACFLRPDCVRRLVRSICWRMATCRRPCERRGVVGARLDGGGPSHSPATSAAEPVSVTTSVSPRATREVRPARDSARENADSRCWNGNGSRTVGASSKRRPSRLDA